ncbi:MAG: DUF6273 domain-containing protein [Atopobiaceae bacterium]|nr:DUF6273 domain-containing protein [Atopobiaceae bacterium]
MRNTIDAYSWDELSRISKLIQSSSDRTAALSITDKYNLTDGNGKFIDASKTVVCNDGPTFRVKLIDVLHDSLSSENALAGMTFLATAPVAHRKMADNTVTNGGWSSSEIRKWLNAEFYDTLPNDLRSAMVSVDKYSNNIGKTLDDGCVTPTSDTLWIPSIVELCGPVDWEYFTDPSNASLFNSVFNREGTQYSYYCERHVLNEENNACLSIGEPWWLRSTAASTGRGRFVSNGGDPSSFGDSNQSLGVVIGFCI